MGKGSGRHALLGYGTAWMAALLLAGSAGATDIREFIHETQQSTNQSDKVTLVWWIPPEFWDVSLASNPNVSAKEIADVHGAMADYQVFALVRASAGLQGLTDLQSKAELLSNARLVIGGKPLTALPPDSLPGGMQAMLGTLKPMLATMLGQLGKSMELVVYPGVADHQKLIDPMKPGGFEFGLYDQTFHWRTPLASLLPKKLDRKTQEEFPGNYNYNPFTGDKLSVK